MGLSGLSTSEVVFWRMLIAWTTLLLYLLIKKKHIIVSKKTLFKLLGNGVLIAFHWYCFFEAIALSNVSIALVFMSTTAFFTSFAEWVVYRKGIDYKELFTGVLVITGISIIVKRFKFRKPP